VGRIKRRIRFLYWGGMDLGRIKLRIRFCIWVEGCG